MKTWIIISDAVSNGWSKKKIPKLVLSQSQKKNHSTRAGNRVNMFTFKQGNFQEIF